MKMIFVQTAAFGFLFAVAVCLCLGYKDGYIDKLEHELTEANAMNRRLKDFNLNQELMINELMVVHVPDKSGNYFGHTRSFLVPVHGVKTYPIPDDCDELVGIRKAIAEYLKDLGASKTK